MSIRSKAIKLAYERPDLRPKLLPLIKAKESSKTAHAGSEILWRLLDQRDFFKLYRTVEKQDKQSAQLLQDITDKLSDSLKIKDNEYNAISRLTQLIKGGQNWDISLQRNNIFKAADLMGIKLPSGMFASQKTAGVQYQTYRGTAIRLTPKELARADEGWTIVRRPQPNGLWMVAAIDVKTGLPFGAKVPIVGKEDTKEAVRQELRMLNKMGLGGDMAAASRHRLSAAHKTAAGLNDLPKVFADMSAMTEGDYEIAMKQRKLQWRSSQWTDVSTWQKAAKAAMPFGYGDFNADKVGRWLKKYEKMGSLEIQAAREYSVALYIRSDNPDLLIQIEKAGRGSSAKVDESDIRKDGTLRLWWD